MDEVRALELELDLDWINTSFNNVNDSTNFTTFGIQEIQNIAPVLSSPSPGDEATGESLTPTLSITATDVNGDCMNISWHSNSSGSWKQFGSADSSATNRFGYDNAGSSYVNINQTILGSNFTCPANGTSYRIYAYYSTYSVGNLKVKGAIYYKSNNTLLATTDEKSIGFGMSNAAWNSFDIITPPSLVRGVEYYFVLWADMSDPTEYLRLYYDTHNSRRGFNQSQTYNRFPDPLDPASEKKVYSIYCTYNTSCLSNNTYYMDSLNFSTTNTTYYWSVNATDGSLWTNSTYSFTTAPYALLNLWPNATGNITELTPSGGTNWGCVNESISDGDKDYVYAEMEVGYIKDTYNLTNHVSESGTINSVTVYVNGIKTVFNEVGAVNNKIKPVIRTNGDYYDGTARNALLSWTDHRDIWTTNPSTSLAWTWNDIDSLEAGVAMKGDSWRYTNCTQVYVSVNYTAS